MIGLPWNGKFADPRRRSVFELLRKTNWHQDHSTQVAKLSLQIFDAISGELALLQEDRELLEYAAYLHDIGYYISHSKHHKHALYIIRNADLKGFREDEIQIMAHVARYHRRSTPKKRHKDYWKLHGSVKKRIKKLAGILRVADGLDRSHYQNVIEMEVIIEEDQLLLNIKTLDEPHLEIWGAMRKASLLEQVANKKLLIKRIM
jgi:exopolyphosphatase/guanosine-5'-triphosphate,3'-diphosphate pyrophosphatase